MTNPRDGEPARQYLGIEGGATHTRALLANGSGRLIAEAETGPANIQLLSDARLLALLRGLRQSLPQPDAIAIGLAGARTESDRLRIRQASTKAWPGVPCYATNDLETALMAAVDSRSDHSPITSDRVLVLSGTGSCCYGRAADGRTARTGGWGHLLGDRGSGYDIGLRALRDTIRNFDRTGLLTPLGRRLLRKLQSNSPEEWVGWIQRASKTEIAALAVEVFAAHSEDPLARRIIRAAAADLASDACACADQIRGRSQLPEFILSGGALLKQPTYARLVRRLIRASIPGASVKPLPRDSVWGAVALARLHFANAASTGVIRPQPSRTTSSAKVAVIPIPGLDALTQSPTEKRNPRSMHLDKLPLPEAIRVMLNEDRRIPPALLRERAKLERAIRWIVRGFKAGGRLYYVGAGTSGRLGVLDASECPPTFRTPPDMVQGIIAGGQTALWESIEGAEDDDSAGADSIRLRGIDHRDVVVGIAASGRTPFVWGALSEARSKGAKTVLICFNPHLDLPPRKRDRSDLVIAPDLGPEILTGSTRLKSGTATKLILNLFTTLAMVRLGKVVGNLMVDLNPSNAKLRDRAVRIVSELKGTTESQARIALERASWVVKDAL